MLINKTVKIIEIYSEMRRGNTNVFKLSGNLALGSNDYLTNQNNMKMNSYGNQSSNGLKKTSTYGQAYQSKQYQYIQKTDSSQQRKASRNQQQNTQNSYGSGMTYGNSYKKIDYNPMTGTQGNDSYGNKGSYGNSNYSKDIYGSDKYSNDKYGSRNQVVRDSSKNNYRNYQNQQSVGSKGSRRQIQSYSNPMIKQSNRQPTKPTNPRIVESNNQQQYRQRDYYEQQPTKAQTKQYDPSTFVPCRQCGRKFNPDSISKHEKVCKKVFINKRPQFNTQEQRLVAKEQKKLMKQGQIVQKKIQQKKKVEAKRQNLPKWKAESLGFRAILKANRRGGQMTQQEKRLVNQAQESSTVKCKFCGRSFSQKAAERHIPFCQSQQKKNAIKRKK